MGLLDHLWDDTVAGPPPDSGLGKLRKFSSFSPSSSTSTAAAASAAVATAGGLQVTRSITMLRTATFSPSSSAASSPRSPSSPGGTGPDSPLASPTPRGDWKRLRRKPTPTAAAEGIETAGPRNPTVYDWVVISSLDR